MVPFVRPCVGLAIAAGLLTAGLPASSQETSGRLEGVVRDTQGGALRAATVEALNRQLATVTTAVTDSDGLFRFPAVPPGDYDVTVTLVGFQTARFEGVEVLLGQTKRLDFVLGPGGVTEVVQVAPTSPLVDVQQATRGYSLREEQLALLPRGLDFTAVVPLLPGVNSEPKLGGLSVDGASAAENRFIVDGMNTTDVVLGVSGQPVSVDSVDELQVKASGYAAEFGGSTGGVINVVTRSGTNRWRGDVRFYVTGDVLEGGPRPTLRRGLQDSSTAEYVTYPEDASRSAEPGVSIGGPLVHDLAWFFASYQPRFDRVERTVTFEYDGSTRTFQQRNRTHGLNASQTSQFGPRLRTRAAISAWLARQDGLLPNQAGSDTPTAQFDIVTDEPTWTVSGAADWLAAPALFVSGRLGYHRDGYERSNVREEPRYVFGRSNVGLLDVPVDLQRVTGFSTERTIFAGTELKTRWSAQVDATWYASFAGLHTLKAGVQAEWQADERNLYNTRPLVGLQWNRALRGLRGRYGYYVVRSSSLDPARGSTERGRAAGSAPGVFVQDAWAVGRGLTISVGLRSERETLPSYGQPGQDAPPILEFGFGDKLAPRVGAAWDVLRDGRWKVHGSWGVFYDIFKYSLSRAFGTLDHVDHYYALDTYEWPTLIDVPGCPPACPGQLIFGPVAAPTFVNPFDAGVKPMRLREATAGVERQLGPALWVAARYVHKQLDRAVEDIGAQDENFQEVYVVGNPGYALAAFAHPGVPLPKAKREYDALELSVRRLLTRGWAFNASYVWSRLHGNMSGLSQSDEEGRVSPNIGRAYDYPAMMFDEGGRPVYGRLATDRPHQLKVFGSYATGFGLTVSLFQSVASGLPVTREAAILPPSYYPVMYLGRGSDGRTPVLSQTDVYVQQEFRLTPTTRVLAAIGVTNLFNQDAVTSVFPIETDPGTGLVFDEDDFYAGRLDFAQLMAEQGIPRDPRFLLPRAFQAPRAAKVMVKLTF